MPHTRVLTGSEITPTLREVFRDQSYVEQDPEELRKALKIPDGIIEEVEYIAGRSRFKSTFDPLTGTSWDVGDFEMVTKDPEGQEEGRIVLIEKKERDGTKRSFMLFPQMGKLLVNESCEPLSPIDEEAEVTAGLKLLARQG